MKTVLKTILKIVKIIWKVIKGIFLTYAVLFSIAFTVALIVAFLYISKPILAVKKLKTINPKQTLYMSTCKQTLLDSGEVDTLMHIFIPIDSIPPILIKAVIAAEDDGFYVHPGFDLAAIARAYEANRAKNRIKHGGSTLTQQMAKNLFVGGEKRFSRKYHELAYTILMESMLGKERILELYLNYAQWGKNIFGCEAASRFYYKKSCKNLSLDEATRLAAVLAKPCRLNPHYTKSILLKKRLRVIGDNLYRKHIIDDTTYITVAETDSLIHIIKAKSKMDSLKSDTSQVDPSSGILEDKKPLSPLTVPGESKSLNKNSERRGKRVTF
jgi:monofunctional biosynthetic peptidoglycan transglycosylase